MGFFGHFLNETDFSPQKKVLKEVNLNANPQRLSLLIKYFEKQTRLNDSIDLVPRETRIKRKNPTLFDTKTNRLSHRIISG